MQSNTRRRKRSRFASAADERVETTSNSAHPDEKPRVAENRALFALRIPKGKSAEANLSNGNENTQQNNKSLFLFAPDDDSSSDDDEHATKRRKLFIPQKHQEDEIEVRNVDKGSKPPDNDSEDDPLDKFMNDIYNASPTVTTGPLILDEEPDDDIPSVKKPVHTQTRRPKRAVYEKLNHSKISYPPFLRDIYRQVPELSQIPISEVAATRRKMGIRIRGRGCPVPISSWPQCGITAAILSLLEHYKFVTPTAIQCQAIPCIMSGRDIIGVSRTGSGKTLAFVLPLLRHIALQPRAETGEGPAALVIAPTRELAIQIYGDTVKLARLLNLRCVCAYGGSGVKDQIAELKRGADVVICTPGRMIDLLAMNSGRITNLRRVTFVVLDEADRMFDMGFEPQLTRIVENVRPDRQTVMFSATFPMQVEKLARKVLNQPIEIMVGGNSTAALTIDQHVEVRKEESKFFRLLELLGLWYERGSTLVFVDRQDNADRIFHDLRNAKYKCLSLHGGMDQADRDSTIIDFKNGDVKILVATSVAARGLDVKNLTLVVNYDVPSHYEDYVHRIGRTGRAGRKGTAYTFITPEQEAHASDLQKALEISAKAAAEQAGEDKEAAKQAAESVVPEELKKLAEAFELKRKAGIVKYGKSSGYGGKGFKFEENDEYDAEKKAIRKMQAKQYGLDDEDDEVAGKSEDEGAKKKEKKEVDDDEGIVAINTGPKTSMSANETVTSGKALSSDDVERLMTEGVMKANSTADAKKLDADARSALIAKAKANVLSLISRRSKNPPEVAVEPSNSSSRFAAELEINDYPQHARWQVTRKNSLHDVEEFTSCVITTRGNYYAPGRNPPRGERKLHFLIEGPTREDVKTARRDIRQKLDEAGGLAGGEQYSKYSVV